MAGIPSVMRHHRDFKMIRLSASKGLIYLDGKLIGSVCQFDGGFALDGARSQPIATREIFFTMDQVIRHLQEAYSLPLAVEK